MSSVSIIVMAAFAIGQVKSQFATKQDALELERKITNIVLEKQKDLSSMVSKQEFNNHQEKTDRRLEDMNEKLDDIKNLIMKSNMKGGANHG